MEIKLNVIKVLVGLGCVQESMMQNLNDERG